jgi:hypothetical protein
MSFSTHASSLASMTIKTRIGVIPWTIYKMELLGHCQVFSVGSVARHLDLILWVKLQLHNFQSPNGLIRIPTTSLFPLIFVSVKRILYRPSQACTATYPTGGLVTKSSFRLPMSIGRLSLGQAFESMVMAIESWMISFVKCFRGNTRICADVHQGYNGVSIAFRMRAL